MICRGGLGWSCFGKFLPFSFYDIDFDPQLDPKLRPAMRSSNPERLGNHSLREVKGDYRRDFVFYQDEGGLRATDDVNELML